jgi:hypothetical protein
MYVEILHRRRDAVRRKCVGNSVQNSWFLCTTHLHICQAQDLPHYPVLSSLDSFPFPRPKSVLKEQRFESADEVTAKATTALRKELKNGFQQ